MRRNVTNSNSFALVSGAEGCNKLAILTKIRDINNDKHLSGDKLIGALSDLSHALSLIPEMEILTVEELGDAVYALRRTSSHKTVVRELLVHYANNLSAASEQASARAIRSLVFGLRYCSNEHAEVNHFLSVLTGHLVKYGISSNSTTNGNIGSDVSVIYGLQSMKNGASHDDALPGLVEALSTYLHNRFAKADSLSSTPFSPISPVSISMSMYGLSNMRVDAVVSRGSSEEAVVRLMQVITKLVDTALEQMQQLSSATPTMTTQGLGMIAFGLRNLSSENETARQLIRSLAGYISYVARMNAVVGDYSIRDLGKVLVGVQGMNSEHAEVREFMSAVLPLLHHIRPDKMSSSYDGIAHVALVSPAVLVGLQHMTADHSVVRDWVDLLTTKYIPYYNAELTTEEVADAVYGLRKLSGTKGSMKGEIQPCHIQAMEVVTELISTNGVDGNWSRGWNSSSNNDIVRIMFGLQNIGSSCTASRNLISALTPCVSTIDVAKKPFTTAQMASICYCLSNMSNRHFEVEGLLRVFYNLFMTQKQLAQNNSSQHDVSYAFDYFSVQQLGMCLYGFQNLSLHTFTAGGSANQQSVVASLINHVLLPLMDIPYLIHSAPPSARLPLVSLAFTGLQNMTVDVPEVRLLLKKLSLVVRSIGGSQQEEDMTSNVPVILNIEPIARILNGLQQMSTGDSGPELLTFLKIMADKIESYYVPSPLSSHSDDCLRHVALCLYGLQNVSADDEEVRRLLSVITKSMLLPLSTAPASMKGLKEPRTFSLSSLSDILYGMRLMSSQHPEVREFIDALNHVCSTSKVQPMSLASGRGHANTNVMWTGLDASRALYGLNRMRSNSLAVCKLLSIITPFYDPSAIRFVDKEHNSVSENAESAASLNIDRVIANCMYGCRNLGSQHDETRALITSLAIFIESLKHTTARSPMHTAALAGNGKPVVFSFSPKSAAMSIYGLKRCSSRSAEVRRLLNALIPKLNTYGHFSPISNAKVSAAVNLAANIDGNVSTNNGDTHDNDTAAEAFTCDDVAMMMNGLQWMDSSSVEVRSLIRLMTNWIRSVEIQPAQQHGQGHGQTAVAQSTMSSTYSLAHIRMILTGLENMSTRYRDVIELLDVLSEQIIKSTYKHAALREANTLKSYTAEQDDDLNQMVAIRRSLQTLTCSRGSNISKDITCVGNLLKHFKVNTNYDKSSSAGKAPKRAGRSGSSGGGSSGTGYSGMKHSANAKSFGAFYGSRENSRSRDSNRR